MSMVKELTSNHIHEYERSKSNKEIYRCIHPKCTHYQKREFLMGKQATCYKCKQIFLLSWPQLRNKKPVCDYCTKSPKAQQLKLAKEISFKALEDLPEDIKQQLIENKEEKNENKIRLE